MDGMARGLPLPLNPSLSLICLRFKSVGRHFFFFGFNSILSGSTHFFIYSLFFSFSFSTFSSSISILSILFLFFSFFLLFLFFLYFNFCLVCCILQLRACAQLRGN